MSVSLNEARMTVRSGHPFAAIVCILLLAAALVLRIAGAQGELWLDEIWSLRLIEQIKAGGVIAAIAFDNNHYLNTLYLALLGPDASAFAQRAFSILIGTATVAIAAYAMRRFGPAAMIAAMGVFAAGYFFVNYGSEARGYAGVIAATLCAIPLAERAMERPDRKTTTTLAVVSVTGFLFQPIMVVSLAVVGIWVLWRLWRATANLTGALRKAWEIFVPTFGSLLPLLTLIGGAAYQSGEYVLGGRTPFSFDDFLEGYAGLYRALFGIPEAVPNPAILILPVGALLILAAVRGSHRLSLGVVALILLPLLVLAVRPSNVQYPRYYLVSGIVFTLILAELFAVAWRSGMAWRAAAVILTAAIAMGNAVELEKLFRYGRGDILPALRPVAEAGQPVLLNLRDTLVVEYLAPRYGLKVTPVSIQDLCTARPGLMLASGIDAPETLTIEGPDCSVTFRREIATAFWGLSGASWMVYRTAE